MVCPGCLRRGGGPAPPWPPPKWFADRAQGYFAVHLGDASPRR